MKEQAQANLMVLDEKFALLQKQREMELETQKEAQELAAIKR